MIRSPAKYSLHVALRNDASCGAAMRSVIAEYESLSFLGRASGQRSSIFYFQSHPVPNAGRVDQQQHLWRGDQCDNRSTWNAM